MDKGDDNIDKHQLVDQVCTKLGISLSATAICAALDRGGDWNRVDLTTLHPHHLQVTVWCAAQTMQSFLAHQGDCWEDQFMAHAHHYINTFWKSASPEAVKAHIHPHVDEAALAGLAVNPELDAAFKSRIDICLALEEKDRPAFLEQMLCQSVEPGHALPDFMMWRQA